MLFRDKIITMLTKQKREKILFSTGCIAIAIAVLSVTIVPFLLNNFTQSVFLSIFKLQIFSAIFYAIAIVCFLFSSEYSEDQINWILIAFGYFIIFQVVAKILS